MRNEGRIESKSSEMNVVQMNLWTLDSGLKALLHIGNFHCENGSGNGV